MEDLSINTTDFPVRNNERCYLCNHTLLENKVYENMFDKRFNVIGNEQNTLSSILGLVLGSKLQEKEVHSPYICGVCKVSLLNYEALARQLFQLRSEIVQSHKQTIELHSIELKADLNTNEEYVRSAEDFDDDPDEDLVEEDSDFSDLDQQYSQDKRYDVEDEELIENVNDESDLCDQYFEDIKEDAVEPTDQCLEESDLIERCSVDTAYDAESDVEQILATQTYDTEKRAQSPKKSQGRRRSQTEFKCSYCDKVCNRRIRLVEHERIHTGERPFKCELCNASFAQRANWRSHLKATHLNESNFKCTECGREFKRQRLLDNHIKSVHTKVRDLQCDHCDARFGNAITLKKHLLCHTGDKKYSCQICGKEFSRAENRNVHQFVHSITKPYACNICNEGFMRKQQLINHSKLTKHLNKKIVRLKPQFSAANSDKLMLQRFPAAATSD